MANSAVVEIFIKAVDDASGPLQGIRDQFQKFKDVGSVFQSVGIQAAGAAAVMLAPYVKGTTVFMEFEQAMKNVGTVANATEEEFKKLTDEARRIGATTKFTATDAAKGFYSLGSAGLKAADQISTLENVTNLAAATNSDLANTSEFMVSVIKQFRLPFEQSSQVADKFASAISGSSANVDKLTNSFRYVGPLAGTLNQNLTTTTAALMGMYDAGMLGEQAGTALRGMLEGLMNPTNEAADIIERYGLKLEEVNPKTNDFLDIVQKFENVGLDAADAMKIFGDTAGPGMLSLLNIGADGLKKFANVLDNDVGRAAKMAAEQQDTLLGAVARLKSSIDDMFIEMGKSIQPFVEGAIEQIQKFIEGWKNLDPAIKNVLTQFGLFAGIGTAVFAALTLIIGGVMKAVGTWKEFGSILKTTIAHLKDYKTIANAFKTDFKKIGDAIKSMVTGIPALLSKGAAAFRTFGSASAKVFSGISDGYDKFIKVPFLKGIDLIVTGFKKIPSVISSAWSIIKSAPMYIFDGFKKIPSIITGLGGVFKSFGMTMLNAFKAVPNMISDIIMKAKDLNFNINNNINALKIMKGITLTAVAAGFAVIGAAVVKATGEIKKVNEKMQEGMAKTIEIMDKWLYYIPIIGDFIKQLDTQSEMKSINESANSLFIHLEDIYKGLRKAENADLSELTAEFNKVLKVISTTDLGLKGLALRPKEIAGQLAVVVGAFEDLGVPVDEFKNKIQDAFGKFDKGDFENAFKDAYDRMKLTQQATEEMSETFDKMGEKGKEAAEGFSIGLSKVDFGKVQSKYESFSETIATHFAEAGKTFEETAETMKYLDFSGIKENSAILRDKLIDDFKRIYGSAGDALDEVRNMANQNFDMIEASSNEMTSALNSYFDVMAKDAARSLGIINDLEFSTADDKIKKFATDAFTILTDVGIDSKLALEAINDLDFSGVKKTVQEAKDEFIDLLVKIGYTKEEAEKKVNDMGFEKMVEKSKKAAKTVKDEFKEKVDGAVSELERINNFRLMEFQSKADSINLEKMRQNVGEATTEMIEKLQKILGLLDEIGNTTVRPKFEYVEVIK